MRPEIEALEKKKTFLHIALNAVNLPSWPNMVRDQIVLQARILAHRVKTRFQEDTGNSAFRGQAPAAEEETDPVLLPDDHPLVTMAQEIAAKDGILPIIYLNQDDAFHNAMVSPLRTEEGQDVASIIFDGNPLLAKNGEAITRGVLGHEIAHLSTSMNSVSKKYLMNTTSSYALLAQITGFFGLAHDKIKTLDVDRVIEAVQLPGHAHGQVEMLLNTVASQPLMLGAAAGFAALAVAVPRMARSHSHATEHIADLHGAELTSPEDAIALMEHLKAQNPPEQKSSLKAIWDRVAKASIYRPFDDTHPNYDERIRVLKESFNMTGETNAVTTATAGPSAPGAKTPGPDQNRPA